MHPNKERAHKSNQYLRSITYISISSMNPSDADSHSNVSKTSSSRRRIPRRSSVVSKSSYQCDESLSSTYIGDVIVDTELKKNQVVNYEVFDKIEVEANEPKNKKPYVPRRLSLYVEESSLNQVTTKTAMMNNRVPRRVSSTVFIGDVVVD